MRYDAAEWAGRLDLKKRGREFVGPCPVCGGEDRFHVRDSGVVGCRGCIDGGELEQRRSAYLAIVKAVFGVSPPPAATKRFNHRQRADDVARQRKAAELAEKMLKDAELDTHPYLERKGFCERKLWVLNGNLLIPVRSVRHGALMSLQRIEADGTKKFLRYSTTRGGVFRLRRGLQMIVCEGLATGLSILEAMKSMNIDASVCVAFSLWNIPLVSANPHGRLPTIAVLDHDVKPKAIEFGERAREKLRHQRVRIWAPPEPGDANDFHQRHGINALCDELRGLLRA